MHQGQEGHLQLEFTDIKGFVGSIFNTKGIVSVCVFVLSPILVRGRWNYVIFRLTLRVGS